MIEINLKILIVQVATFLVALAIVWKLSWRPLARLLLERREKIRKDLEDAEHSRRQAEELLKSYQDRLKAIDEQARALRADSEREAQKIREQILRGAEDESRRLRVQTSQQLEEERARLSRELRREVSALSIQAAEKLLRHAMNAKEQEHLLQ